MAPCLPRSWRDFEITYRKGPRRYHIKVENPHGLSRGVAEVELDGQQLETLEVPLTDDGKPHRVRIVLGEKLLRPQPGPAEEANLDSILNSIRQS